MTADTQNNEFVCIEPAVGEQIYDYHSGMLDDEAAREFEAHLLLCFKCQDDLAQIDRVMGIARDVLS